MPALPGLSYSNHFPLICIPVGAGFFPVFFISAAAFSCVFLIAIIFALTGLSTLKLR